MTVPEDDGGILSPGQGLYDLLPAIYRNADAGESYPLLALMQVFEHVFADLEAGLPVLEEGWFIETCALERVPAIAAMVGTHLSLPLRPEQRARVADTLALRRRAGLAMALPRLIRGASGWYTLFSPDLATPPASWPLPGLDAPGQPMPLTAAQDEPKLAGSLRVWRLPVLHACGATPAPGAVPGRFTFDPLGYAAPLWNVTGTALPMAAAPPVTALPAAVGRVMLAADLARLRRDRPDGVGTDAPAPGDSLLYGPARGLAIRAQGADGTWRTIPPSDITSGPLSDGEPVPPDYPALLSGPIDPKTFAPGTTAYVVDVGDTRAEIVLDLTAGMGMGAVATALKLALAHPRSLVTQGSVPPEALAALIVGAVGDRLAIVPPGDAVLLAFAATAADPLALAGPNRSVVALGTVPIEPDLARRLTAAPAGGVLAFSGDGRAFAIPLPLAVKAERPTPEDIATALRALLPDCFVCVASGRIVIVPVPLASPAGATVAPDTSGLARDLGLVATLVIDPESGTFAWPSAWAPVPPLAVDYGYAVAAEIGGGSYPRPSGDGAAFRAPVNETVIVAADEPGGLDAALLQWRPTDAATVIRLDGGGTRTLAAAGIALAAGQSLRIVAAGAARACLVRPDVALTIAGPVTGGGRLVLDGATITASLAPAGGDLDLALRDLTLIPSTALPAIAAPLSPPGDPRALPPPSAGEGGPRAQSGEGSAISGKVAPLSRPSLTRGPPSPAEGGGDRASSGITAELAGPVGPADAPGDLRLEIVRCRISPIDLAGLSGRLSVADSVFSAMPVPAFDSPVLGVPAAFVTRIARTTLMGRAAIAGRLDAADTLFAGALTCGGPARFDHCFVTELNVPRPVETGDASAAVVIRCTACNGIRALRLRQCHLARLFLRGESDTLCICDAPQDGPPRDCTACRDPDCAKTCPLQAADQSWEPTGAAPIFESGNRYPLPGFARLSDANPPAILSGAADRDVIGAGNRAAPTARARDFEAALREALLFGTGLGVVFEI